MKLLRFSSFFTIGSQVNPGNNPDMMFCLGFEGIAEATSRRNSGW
jgi:hypothetical protein